MKENQTEPTEKVVEKKNQILKKALNVSAFVGAGLTGAAASNLATNVAAEEFFNEIDTLEDTSSEGFESSESTGQVESSQVFNPLTAPVVSEGTISDDMNFNEAFSAARLELGAGGVFSFNGEYYSTFYANELNEEGNPTVDYNTIEEHSLPELDTSEAQLLDQDEMIDNDEILEEKPTDQLGTATDEVVELEDDMYLDAEEEVVVDIDQDEEQNEAIVYDFEDDEYDGEIVADATDDVELEDIDYEDEELDNLDNFDDIDAWT